MPRLKLTDSIPLAVAKLAQGQRGASIIILLIITYAQKIDPSNKQFAILYLLIFDNLEVFGNDIVTLYRKVCKKNLVQMLAILRAWHLAGISGAEVKRMIHTETGDNGPVLYHYVKTFVPDFDSDDQGNISFIKIDSRGLN